MSHQLKLDVCDFIENYTFLCQKSIRLNQYIQLKKDNEEVYLIPRFLACAIFEKYSKYEFDDCVVMLSSTNDKSIYLSENLEDLLGKDFDLKKDVVDVLDFICFNQGQLKFMRSLSNQIYQMPKILKVLKFDEKIFERMSRIVYVKEKTSLFF